MKVLVLLGSKSDLSITEGGVALLKEFKIPFQLRVASAHRTPAHVLTLIKEFEDQGGQVLICVAGMSAHLAGVVAAHTLLPVIAVPVYNEKTAGFDALLSMGQMPPGIPVATMGLSGSGFTNAAILASQMIGLADPALKKALKAHREKMTQTVLSDDAANKIEFRG